MICIKSVKYGGTYVPKEEERAKNTKQPTGENALDAIKEDIARIQDELIKKNRDNLDAMYNIDMDNFSTSFKKQLGNAFASIETSVTDTQAKFEAIAKWQDDTTTSIANIKGTADKNSASISSIATWQDGVNSSIASIKQTADTNSSSISSLTSWKSSASSSIASIEQTVNDNSASITQIVSLTGEDGKELYAAFKIAAEGDESFIQAIADKVEINAGEIDLNGYVKFADLKNSDGTTEVSGNNVALVLDGAYDTGSNSFNDTSRISFRIRRYDEEEDAIDMAEFARIRTLVTGKESDDSPRYQLMIGTEYFRASSGAAAYPTININAAGHIIEQAGRGYILLDAYYNTRIAANRTYNSSQTYDISDYHNEWIFCTDGIYYNGNCLVST